MRRRLKLYWSLRVKGRNYGVCRKCGKTHVPAKRASDVVSRFWSKVKRGNPDDCWLWTAKIEWNGYGRFWFDGHSIFAHRFAYELIHGPIPKGLTIDHRCRNKACVNPAHLEVVTLKTNVLRGPTITARFAAKTHCPKGHPYDMFNTYTYPDGRRSCRECARQRIRQWRERRRNERKQIPNC